MREKLQRTNARTSSRLGRPPGRPAAAAADAGCTPLHHAISDNYVDVVKLLIEWKALNVKDNSGQTPLNLAAGKGHVEICSILAADVDVNVTGQNGSTPLHDAAFGGHADVVTLLLEDTSRDDPGGMTAPGGPGGLRLCQTPLDVARNQGQHEVATLLESVASWLHVSTSRPERLGNLVIRRLMTEVVDLHPINSHLNVGFWFWFYRIIGI